MTKSKHPDEIAGYFTAQKAARTIGISVSTVQIQLWRGILKGIKVGGAWFIHEDEVKRYRAENKGNVGRPSKSAKA